MAAEKSPAFQFYPKDFLTDSHVVAMTLPERGAYITLLCLCWMDHSIPSDHAALARLCGTTNSSFTKIWPSLSPCFTKKDGRLIQPRIERERQKQTTYRNMKAEAGRLGGKAKAEAYQTASSGLADTMAESSPPSSSSFPSPSPSPSSSSIPVSIQQAKRKIRTAPAAQPVMASPVENVKIITKLAHEVLAGLNGHAYLGADVVDEIKTLCAQRHIVYDSETVRRALDSAEIQRKAAHS